MKTIINICLFLLIMFGFFLVFAYDWPIGTIGVFVIVTGGILWAENNEKKKE